jgi:hypothetical protein
MLHAKPALMKVTTQCTVYVIQHTTQGLVFLYLKQWHTQEFFSLGFTAAIFPGGVQLIQLRIEGRENGDLGAVAP